MERSGSAPVALGEARQRTIDTLCRHFADDALDLTEFEERVERAHRAVSLAELQALLADLPGGATPAKADGVPARRPPAAPSKRDTLLAILGGVDRRGPWTPPRELVVGAVLGGADLDFREARLEPGVTEVAVYAFMGGVRIIVPPGMRVETGGLAFMGGFDPGPAPHQATPGPETPQTAPGPDAPALRIRAYAVMGGVSIERRGPGEAESSGAPASRRARLKGR